MNLTMRRAQAFTRLDLPAENRPWQRSVTKQASPQTKDGGPVPQVMHEKKSPVLALEMPLTLPGRLTEEDLEKSTELSEDLEAQAEIIVNELGHAHHRDILPQIDARTLIHRDDRPLQSLSSARRPHHQDLHRDSVNDREGLPA